MTMRTYGLLTLLFAASFAAPARAEFAIAECSISNGCSCRMADLTVADFELLTNTTAPDGARDMTLVHVPGSDPYWTSVDRTQINNTYGGTGQCDLQLFNSHGPEDGNWKVTAGQPDLSACPMLKGKMPVGGLMESATRHIEWEGSFHPSRLSDAGPPVDWRKVGRNSWRGTLFNDQRGTSGAKVVHGMTLENPRLIRGWSLFEFKIDLPAEEAAILSSMGMPMQCRSYTRFVARRTS